MASGPRAGRFILLEHRKVDDPQRPPSFFEQPAVVADARTQCTERVVDDLGAVGTKEDDVATGSACALENRAQHVLRQKLDDRRLQPFLAGLARIIYLDVRKPLGAVDSGEYAIVVEFLAGH